MSVYFLDPEGNEGQISDDLDVSFHGSPAITDSVESCVREFEADEKAVDDVFYDLVIELPDRCDVVEAGLDDDPSGRE